MFARMGSSPLRTRACLVLCSALVAGCSLDWSAKTGSQSASSDDAGPTTDGSVARDGGGTIDAGVTRQDGGEPPCPDSGDGCACEAGYALVASGCTDVDECQRPDRGGCSPDASCRNVPGSRVCTCNPGFEDPSGDGTQCVNACDVAGCDENALCTLRGEQAECSCTPPYVGDGLTCVFDDACALLGCDVHAECKMIVADSRECICTAGYEGSGTSCTNIDECAVSPSPCASNARCVDTDGFYRCDCDAGYAPVAGVCTNVDDCTPQPCQNGGSCTDQVGGFTCDCAGTGYSGPQCQTNVDDCASLPCQNGGQCIDGVLGFTCDCDGTGHSGDRCQSTMGTCCSGGDCLCHGPNPTQLTSTMGPYATTSYVVVGAGCVHYPTDAEPPFAAVAIADGFAGTGGCGSVQVGAWAPFYASHGIVVMIVDTGSGDQPGTRGAALLRGIAAFKAENTNSISPLFGKLAGRFGAAGFSMGGGGATYAARDDSTLRTNLAIMPWSPVTSGVTVPTLILCGEADMTAPCDVHGVPAYDGIANSVPKMRVMVSGGHVGAPTAGGGAVGRYGLAFQKVFLEGDERWRPLLIAAGAEATNID